jgi:hypothetical protein
MFYPTIHDRIAKKQAVGIELGAMGFDIAFLCA